MKTTKIIIGRLFNLGSYEHIRYEITVEVTDGESASTAIIGMEKIIKALNPKTSTRTRGELDREQNHLLEMMGRLSLPEDEFRRHYGHFVGTPREYFERCQESHSKNVAERDAWEARSAKARQLLDNLGGAAEWKDSKLDWESDYDEL